jgi:hypothetical protein
VKERLARDGFHDARAGGAPQGRNDGARRKVRLTGSTAVA